MAHLFGREIPPDDNTPFINVEGRRYQLICYKLHCCDAHIFAPLVREFEVNFCPYCGNKIILTEIDGKPVGDK